MDQTLIGVGEQQGLLPEDVSGVNKYKYLKDIDLAARAKEINQDLDAIDTYSMADQQLVHKLTSRLEGWIRSRHELATGNDPEEIKRPLLDRYDKNIRYLEAKLDAQQTGLLLSPNGKETQRLTEGQTYSRADYPPETDEDAN